MTETKKEVSINEITKPKLSKSNKDLHKSYNEHKSNLSEIPFDRELNLKLKQLNDRIVNKKAHNNLLDNVIEQEIKRNNRNLKLEKVSDLLYRVNSFWFNTEFIIDDKTNPVKYIIKWDFSKIDTVEIVTTNIDTILELSNLMNYGMFFIQNAIKEDPNYLNTSNINGNDIFSFDIKRRVIIVKSWQEHNSLLKLSHLRYLILTRFYINFDLNNDTLITMISYLNHRSLETFSDQYIGK